MKCRAISAHVCLSAFVVLAPSMSAMAQSAGVLTGRVIDAKTQAPIAQALVIATANSLQGEQSVTTDQAGFFRLPSLPAGLYNLQIFSGSYRPYEVTAITLRSGQTLRVDARLRVGEQSVESLVIDAPIIDLTSTTAGASFQRDFLTRVPIAAPSGQGGLQRSFEQVAAAAPGAKTDTAGTSLAGATSPENAYRIDGMSVGSPRVGTLSSGFSIEFMQEVAVVDGGYLPEYGRSAGGTISAITKSGGNALHGGAWMTFSPGSLQAKPPWVIQQGNSLAVRSRLGYRGDVGADLGGKIIHDKLWYYVGVAWAREAAAWDRRWGWFEREPKTGTSGWHALPGVGDSLRGQQSTLQALAKLTYSPVADHRFTLTGAYFPGWNGDRRHRRMDVNLNGTVSSMHSRQQTHTSDIALRWEATALDKRLGFDTSVIWHREQTYDGPDDGQGLHSKSAAGAMPRVIWSPEGKRSLDEFTDLRGQAEASCRPITDDSTGELFLPCPVRNYSTGGVGEIYERQLQRWQLKQTTSLAFQGWGHHTAKAGLDLEFLTYANRKGKSGGSMVLEQPWGVLQDFERIGVLSAPDHVTYLPSYRNATSSLIWGAFVQDQWHVADRVALNAGVRYDGQFVTAQDRLWLTVPRQLGPRIGLVWDPSQKGQVKLYVNYARTYQGLLLEMAAVNGSVEPKALSNPAYDGCLPLARQKKAPDCLQAKNREIVDSLAVNRYYDLQGASPAAVDPKLKPTASDEVLGGIDVALTPRLSVGLGYRKRWLAAVVEDMSRDEGGSFFMGNPGLGMGRDFPRATRRYDALWLTVQRSMSRHWMISGSYTVSWLRGNYSGSIKPENGALQPGHTSDFDLVSLQANRMGYLPGDQRHQIKVYGAYEYPLGNLLVAALGGAFEAFSGAPFSHLGSHPFAGSRESFLLPRGSAGRLPWRHHLNLSLRFGIKLGEERQLAAQVEVFNALNRQQVIAVDELYTADPLLQPLTKRGAKPADLAKAAHDLGVTQNPNFGHAVQRQEPTAMRFSLRLTF